MSAPLPKAFAVSFADLHFWSPRSFAVVRWAWPDEWLAPLGSVLTRREQAVEPNEAVRLVTLPFSGRMRARDRGDAESTKGRLFRARRGDLVFSKIDLRNGAVGTVPDDLDDAAVSSEYPVYALDVARVEPEFVARLMRTAAMRRHLNGMVAGTSGRKRITPEAFEALRVPVPPLDVQRAIVAHAERAEAEAAALLAEADTVEATAHGLVYAALGTPAPRLDRPAPKAFALPWSDLDRWSLFYQSRKARSLVGFVASRYPIVPLDTVVTDTGNGRSIRPTALPTPYRVLKLSALTTSGLDTSKAKPAEMDERTAEQFALCAGDLLMCRSIGSFDQIAKCAVVQADDPAIIFPDIVIRVRFTADVLPDYVREVIQTPLGRSFFQTNARTAVGMWKIGAEDIRAFPLPLPPLDVQAQIVADVQAVRARADALRANARALRRQSAADTDARLLGTAPPPAP